MPTESQARKVPPQAGKLHRLVNAIVALWTLISPARKDPWHESPKRRRSTDANRR